ncbi:hypothetical protein, partial [Ornithinimicrobium cerasi]|uniref:hypothetical protein n=1 Tax=Ornithinimicrobium cerasi TaxID=2248773 RepID=UPI00137A8E5A
MGEGLDVVAFVVEVLHDMGQGGPVLLGGEAWVEPVGEGSPALFGGLPGGRFEPGTHVASVVELLGGDRVGVVVPGVDGLVQGSAGGRLVG